MGISLCRYVEDHGPTTFTAAQLRECIDLFAERAALFFTPTSQLPEEWIGRGVLDASLPLALPSWFEFTVERYHSKPRVWVDLLQRATGKIRWAPTKPANISITRFDSVPGGALASVGAKALIDALKVATTGRHDGRLVHYFGAIVDDGEPHVSPLSFTEELVEHPSDACCRVLVAPS